MRGQVDNLGQEVLGLAARQHGVVSRRQLADALGLGADRIDRLVARGWLHPTQRGIYSTGSPLLTDGGRSMAALLAVRGSVLSHHSAAALWGLRRTSSAIRHLTVPAARSGSERRGIVVHRARLPASEMTVHQGLAVTTPARTLLDVAAVLPHALERIASEAERLRLFDLQAVRAVLTRHPRRRGTPALAALLDAQSLGLELTRSELEIRFLELCREHGIAAPLVNVPVGAYEADFLWRPQRLIAETDGASIHLTRAAFERDRTRDAELTAAGYRVVRFTYRRVTQEPRAIAALLRGLLAA